MFSRFLTPFSQPPPPPLEPPWPYCHTFSTPVDSLNYFPHRHPVALPRLPLQKVLIRSRLVALPSDSQAGASALPRLHGGSPAHLLGPCERTARHEGCRAPTVLLLTCYHVRPHSLPPAFQIIFCCCHNPASPLRLGETLAPQNQLATDTNPLQPEPRPFPRYRNV